ncbi:hypothetical protein BGX38DRAFT_1188976 [Terfezia claveryi]|nr:hypothetical protein BGX38DRAFT_1188976 [Terfezia claveryi]
MWRGGATLMLSSLRQQSDRGWWHSWIQLRLVLSYAALLCLVLPMDIADCSPRYSWI